MTLAAPLTSIRTRLTLWYSAVLAALVVGFAIGSFILIREVLARRADRFLADAVSTFSEEVRKEQASAADVRSIIRDELVDYRFREIEFFVIEGDRLIGRSPPRAERRPPAIEEDITLEVAALVRELHTRDAGTPFTLADEEGGFRVVGQRLVLPSASFTIAAVQSWHGYAETLELIAVGYLVIVPLLILLSMVGGYWLAARSLAPVAVMSGKAASIGRQNLGERIVPANPRDELGQLAGTFNEMLERLETAFTQQQQFMQDASHELRSPVAAVRMEAEVTLRHEHRAEHEYRDALTTIRRSSMRLSRIVDDLFFLARHDAERYQVGTATFDLGEGVRDAARSLRPLADACAIRLELADAPESPVCGREADVVRAVVNLVENALKFARCGTVVRIEVAPVGERAYAVRVSDQGPGIAAEARERIFDRFYRIQDEATPATPGAGLGLPIARALAEAHGGRLELESSSAAGSTFALILPRAGAA